jgi:hypothetical protein
MLVSIYPGASRPDVLEALRDIHSKISDAANVQGSAVARATAYLGWTNDSVRMLEHRVSAADISRLVLTPGYERLLAATGILSGDDTATKGVLTGLLRREIERQGELLEVELRYLDAVLAVPVPVNCPTFARKGGKVIARTARPSSA